MIRVNDLFSGGGGVGVAVDQLRERGLDIEVTWAANHWPLACALHRIRHPRTPVACQDLCQFDFRHAPACDLLWASSACQGHSEAGQPARAADPDLAVAHDNLRATAWAVVNAVLAKSPQAFIVENVREFVEWAPPPRLVSIEATEASARRRTAALDRSKITRRKDGWHVLQLFEPGSMYRHWLNTFRLAGYHMTEQVVNAAAWGEPQNRHRLLIVGHLDGEVSVVEPEIGHVAPLRDAMDLDEGDWTPIDEMSSRKPAAQARVRYAHERFGGEPCWGQHVSYSFAWGCSLDRPSNTVTTKNQHWLTARGRYRLWSVAETARVMGFPGDYFDGVRPTAAKKMAGNAIVPAMGAGAIEQVAATITARRRTARRERSRS